MDHEGFIARLNSARADRWGSGLLILLTVVFYSALRSEEQSGDSLSYAYSIETGEKLFHPHHILFSPAVRVLFLFARRIYPSCDAVSVAQMHNILWAAVAIVSLFFAVRILLNSRLCAMSAALMLLACNGLFVYSTQAEVYVPATGCLSLVLLLLVTGHKHGWSASKLVFLSVFFALSVLYHQSNLIFVFPLTIALLIGSIRQKASNVTSVLCLSGTLILATYVLGYSSTGSPLTVRDFFHFCFAYADHPNPAWGTIANFNTVGVALLLKSQLRNIVYLPPGTSAPVLFALAFFGLTLGGLFVYGIRQISRTREYRKLRISLIVWLVAYYIFFLWWLPGEDEFFVTTLIPLLMLTSISVQDLSRYAVRSSVSKSISIVAAGTLVAVFAFNLNYSLLPRAGSKGASYEEASRIAAVVSKDCTILCGYWELQHLRYYFQRESVVEAELILLYAYHRGPIPDKFRLDVDKCVLAPLSVVVPDYRGVGTNGYEDRLGWLTFFMWLFDVRDSSDPPAKTLRGFELVRDKGGTDYLLLSAQRVEVADWKQLFGELDRSIGSFAGRKFNAFLSWLESGEHVRNALH